MAVTLAVAGAILTVVGVGVLSVPVAVIWAGVVLIAAAYVVRFMQVNGGTE